MPRRTVAPRTDTAGRHAVRRRAFHRARRFRCLPDRCTTSRPVAVRRGLRAARRRDAAQCPERSRSLAHLAPEGRSGAAQQSLLRQARRGANAIHCATDDSVIFTRSGGCARGRSRRLSGPARAILRVLRREWEMATSDLRGDAGIKDRAVFNRALDELQAAMLVIPSEVYYQPKFTYIWTLAVGRFPDELRRRLQRSVALREIARCFLSGAGMTIPGELARVTGLSRVEAGLGNRALVPRALPRHRRAACSSARRRSPRQKSLN